MPTYASQTSVTSDKSRAEIERTLARYGASSFMYGWDQLRAIVAFEMHGRRLKFVLPMPERDGREFTHTPATAPAAWPAATPRQPPNSSPCRKRRLPR